MRVEILHESNKTLCEPIDKSQVKLACYKYYNFVSFPNLFGHYKQTEAAQAMDIFKTMFANTKTLCYEHLVYGLCQAFFPECPTTNGTMIQLLHGGPDIQDTYYADHLVTICTEMCDELVDACHDVLEPVIGAVRCGYYNSEVNSETCVYKNVTCAAPIIPENIKRTKIKDNYAVGDTIVFECLDGYELGSFSSGTINCTYSGQWTTIPTCDLLEIERKSTSEKSLLVVLLPVLSITLTATGTIIFLMLRRHRKKKKRCVQNITKRERPYDAFVSYFSEGNDQTFVRQELHPSLEREVHPPFKLIFHERDFRADTLILANIRNAIKDSNAAIIVMSQEYVDSDWCRAEFEECMVEADKDPAYRLFVIMLQPHETLINCTFYMDKYFRDKTYLDKEDEFLFGKLTEYLRELQVPDEEIIREHLV